MEENEKLFYDNIGIVKKIVERMNYGYVDEEDLMQAGLIGLNLATKKFRKENGASFITFATYYIIGEIKKEIRNNKSIHLSREMYKIIKELKQSVNESLDELALRLKTSKENILLAMNYKDHVVSLNKENDEESELLDLIKSSDDSKIKLHDIKECLDEKMYFVIYHKYFLRESQQEIANLLNLNQSKVSRIEKKAIEKIKKFYLE